MRLSFCLFICVTAAAACLGATNVASSAASSLQPGTTERANVRPPQETTLAQRAEQVRMECIEGRRYVCGRVLQVFTNSLVVDSGYTALLNPPFNRSWVVRGNVSVTKSPSLIEEKKPDAVCVGLVLLTNIPKRPAVKAFDYVVIHGYPAGEYKYVPVPGVEKQIRQFSASLEKAVSTNLAASEK